MWSDVIGPLPFRKSLFLPQESGRNRWVQPLAQELNLLEKNEDELPCKGIFEDSYE